mmetsp:Transcript_4687/g.13516  ORF Transcript_4687/g.13516 Transcript_4687/m.13516 type:complete len:87 (-) Transcript_4687:611-871(-)
MTFQCMIHRHHFMAQATSSRCSCCRKTELHGLAGCIGFTEEQHVVTICLPSFRLTYANANANARYAVLRQPVHHASNEGNKTENCI